MLCVRRHKLRGKCQTLLLHCEHLDCIALLIIFYYTLYYCYTLIDLLRSKISKFLQRHLPKYVMSPGTNKKFLLT